MLVGHGGDETLAETLPAVVRADGQKENVAVPADGGEPDQTIDAPVEVEIDRRTPVGVLEEPAPLPEHTLFTADALFQLPGLVGVFVVTEADNPPLDVDAHYR